MKRNLSWENLLGKLERVSRIFFYVQIVISIKSIFSLGNPSKGESNYLFGKFTVQKGWRPLAFIKINEGKTDFWAK